MDEKFPEELHKEKEELVTTSKLDLDKVLIEEAGPFGRYQITALGFCLLLVLLLSVTSHAYVFITGRVPTRCFIPECEIEASSAPFAPSWLSKAVPTTNSGFDQCRKYLPINVSNTIDNETCPEYIFDRYVTIPCETFIYENMDTVVYEFDIACNEWRRTILSAGRTIGNILGLAVTGCVSDRFGRRKALAVNIFNSAWIGLSRYWANSYIGFFLCELAETTFGGGLYTSCYILMMEIVGSKHRVAFGAIFSSTFASGHVMLSFIAYLMPNWRHLTLTMYIAHIAVLPVLFFMPESFRWYLSKGRVEEATKALKDIARVNKKKLSEKTLRSLENTHAEVQKINPKKCDQENEEWLVKLVFRYKPILLRCLLAPIWWVSFTFVYYGLTVNSVNLSVGNKYVNFAVVSLFEIPGFWITFAFIDRVGRKPVLVAGYWLCALTQLGYILIPNHYGRVLFTLFMLGKGSISVVVTALYIYTSELFPTRHRHRLVAFCSLIGRFGSILAPLTPAFGGNLPYVLFGGGALLAGALILITPETLGTKLPDTMEEAARIGKKDAIFKKQEP